MKPKALTQVSKEGFNIAYGAHHPFSLQDPCLNRRTQQSQQQPSVPGSGQSQNQERPGEVKPGPASAFWKYKLTNSSRVPPAFIFIHRNNSHFSTDEKTETQRNLPSFTELERGRHGLQSWICSAPKPICSSPGVGFSKGAGTLPVR